MLWLALRFPQLPLDVFYNEIISAAENSTEVKKNTLPLVVYHAPNGRKTVLLSNDTAESLGVRKGMALATAEALLQVYHEQQHQTCDENETPPPLNRYLSFERDPSREWVALQQLASRCYEFTPHVSLHNTPELKSKVAKQELQPGLLLEISGSLKLFKGLANLCQQLCDSASELHCVAQIGLGPSPESAWILSNSRMAISDDLQKKDCLQQLGNIDLAYIDCFTDAFEQLRKVGLNQLQQVLAMPMVELGRRFGEGFIEYLQALLGKNQPARSRLAEQQAFRRRAQLNYAVIDVQQLLPVMANLLQQLAQYLQREQLQCQAIEWLLLSATGERQTIAIVCQPIHSDWQLLQQLTQIHLDHRQSSFEVETVELLLSQSAPFTQETGDLFASDPELALDHPEIARRWQLLLTRLHNRLGNDSTLELAPLPEHWPEQLNHWQASRIEDKPKARAYDKQPENLDWIDQLGEPSRPYGSDNPVPLAPRPAWLIDPPEAIKEHNHQLFWHGPLTLLLGPERLQGRWWQQACDSPSPCRDYFIAEQSDFRRLWIYHDHQARQWFLQGVFS